MELDERVMQADNMSRAWESVAELNDVPTLNSSFEGTSACSSDSISSSELQRRILPDGAQRTRTLCPPGVDITLDNTSSDSLERCRQGAESDPEDYPPLTELANRPDTPPRLPVDPEEEVAPTQLDVIYDTLPVSDSDDATLDYNSGPLAQQGMLHLQASLLPTRTTDDDPISQFSSDEEPHMAFLLQRGFIVRRLAPQSTAPSTWQQWWVQFAPQFTLLCSAIAWLNSTSWRTLQSLFLAVLADGHHCRPRVSRRSAHPLRGVRVGEASHPGPGHRLPKKTTTSSQGARNHDSGTSSRRSSSSSSSRQSIDSTRMDVTPPGERSASEPPMHAHTSCLNEAHAPGASALAYTLEDSPDIDATAPDSSAAADFHASPLASAFQHATQPVEVQEPIAGDGNEEPTLLPGIALPSAISLQRDSGKEAVLRCNYLSSRKTYCNRYQVRSQPALLGPDRRTQFAALQAWTQQHSAALAAESRTHLKEVVLEWQERRHQHAHAPSGESKPHAVPASDSSPLSWSQFDAISGANIRVQRNIPCSLHTALKEQIRVLLQTSAPNHGKANREQPNAYDLGIAAWPSSQGQIGLDEAVLRFAEQQGLADTVQQSYGVGHHLRASHARHL
eukprot:464645-Amphidinium_carterae.2